MYAVHYLVTSEKQKIAKASRGNLPQMKATLHLINQVWCHTWDDVRVWLNPSQQCTAVMFK